jgi:threonine dehydratase
MRRHLDDIVTVDDDQIAEAIVLLMERAKCVVEGAGAVGLAALLAGHIPSARGSHACVVLSGGNIDATLLDRVLRRGLARAGRYLSIESRVKDRPGELSGLLDIVAEMDANVLTVEHHREDVGLPVDEVEVRLTVETRNATHARELVARLRGAGYPVIATPPDVG